MELRNKAAGKYQKNILYYSSWGRKRQLENVDLILEDIQMYNSLLSLLSQYGEKTTIAKERSKFEFHLLLFPYILQ